MSLQYRPEVDGLRAIAVVPVILFHAGFSHFAGGYVGVDIFFVISGYLITSIIKTELQKDTFSLIGFYERRARRILPALFLVIILCMPFAWLWMSEVQFKDFSASIVDVSVFISNFYFWSNGGYFDPAAETRPLLHTWSLAVEEQFYIFFPLLFTLMWRFSRSRLPLYLFLIALFSLLLCELGWRYAPSANFYLMPTRAWELLAGALCAFVRPRVADSARDVLSITGFLLIISAILLFDETVPFPSLFALIPVIGAVLIILFGISGTVVARILSSPGFTGIGLVSYSAYLWHQPVFAFARIRSHAVPSESLMLLLILLVFILAYLSWRFVERPFRISGHDKCTRYQPVPIGFAAVTSIIVLGGLLQQKSPELQNKVYLSLLPLEQQRMYAFLKKHQQAPRSITNGGECVFQVETISEQFEAKFDECLKSTSKRAIMLLGDSHAINLFNALALSEFDPFLIGVVRGGCRPYDSKQSCQYASFLEFAEQRAGAIERVIFHQSGSYLLSDPDGNVDSMTTFFNDRSYSIVEKDIDGISEYLKRLSQWTEVSWLGPFVEARIVLGPWLTSDELQFNPVSIKAFDKLDDALTKRFATQRQSFDFIPINQFLKPLVPSLVIGDCLIVRDADHFSNCGEARLGELLKKPLQLHLLEDKQRPAASSRKIESQTIN